MSIAALEANIRRQIRVLDEWIKQNGTKRVDGVEIDQTFRAEYQQKLGELRALVDIVEGNYD